MTSADNGRAAEKIGLIFSVPNWFLFPGNEFGTLEYRYGTAIESTYSFHMLESLEGGHRQLDLKGFPTKLVLRFSFTTKEIPFPALGGQWSRCFCVPDPDGL